MFFFYSIFIVIFIFTPLYIHIFYNNSYTYILNVKSFSYEESNIEMFSTYFFHYSSNHLAINLFFIIFSLIISFPSNVFPLMALPCVFLLMAISSTYILFNEPSISWVGLSIISYSLLTLSILYSKLRFFTLKLLLILVLAISCFFEQISLTGHPLSLNLHLIAISFSLFYFFFTEAYDYAYNNNYKFNSFSK